ncbi:hypothetical protein ACTFIR_007517 [Dictyostelium discoideum]
MSTTVNNNDASSSTQRSHYDSDTENEQSEDESCNNVDVPTDYQLSDTLLGQYKHMANNQGLLVEEEYILKKYVISELNKVFIFPSVFQVNVTPFGTPEGITVSSTVKNNDTDLLIVENRVNDSLKPLLLISKLISFLTQSAIVLAVNAQASLSRVRRNNIAKEIYGSEVLLPIKIKDTPKMFDETETERSNTKKSVNSSGNNTTGNNSSNNTKSAYGTNNLFQKNKK